MAQNLLIPAWEPTYTWQVGADWATSTQEGTDKYKASAGTITRLMTDATYYFWRFENVPIPKGATITAASLRPRLYYGSSKDTASSDATWTGRFYCHNVGNSPPLTSGVEESLRAKTAASVLSTTRWKFIDSTQTPMGAGQWREENTFTGLQAPINEIVNRADWQYGNALTLMTTYSSQSAQYILYLDSPSYDGQRPRLSLTWTPPAGQAYEALAEPIDGSFTRTFNSYPHKRWDGTAWVEAVRTGY